MRAFHFAWLSFFIAFFGWFSIPPLMPTIKRELQLTSDQVSNFNIASVANTIIGRVATGPLWDRYGPRTVQAVLLVLGSILVGSAALVTNHNAFIIVRFFIGFVGCSFIATTYWTSVMFCTEIIGCANSLAAGWGNLGAGVTYLITPLIYDLFTIHATVSDDTSWRLTLILPAISMPRQKQIKTSQVGGRDRESPLLGPQSRTSTVPLAHKPKNNQSLPGPTTSSIASVSPIGVMNSSSTRPPPTLQDWVHATNKGMRQFLSHWWHGTSLSSSSKASSSPAPTIIAAICARDTEDLPLESGGGASSSQFCYTCYGSDAGNDGEDDDEELQLELLKQLAANETDPPASGSSRASYFMYSSQKSGSAAA